MSIERLSRITRHSDWSGLIADMGRDRFSVAAIVHTFRRIGFTITEWQVIYHLHIHDVSLLRWRDTVSNLPKQALRLDHRHHRKVG